MPHQTKEDDEGDLAQLPPDLLAEVDRAFDKILNPGDDERTSRRKRRKLNSSGRSSAAGGFVPSEEPGGFFVDDTAQGGGFVTEDVGQSDGSAPALTNGRTRIPLSSIPAALKLLRLPTDDEEVLAIFEDAASGWGGEADDEGVSRDDWRAVCAVLLTQRGDEEEEEEEDIEEGDEYAQDASEPSGDDNDVWRPYGEDDEDEGLEANEGSDYEEEGRTTASRARRRGRNSLYTTADISFSDLSPRQRKECRETFELFLDPGGARGPGLDRRIGKDDLVRVAQALKEKLSLNEITEMLEAFSSTPDNSIALEDFARIMIQSNLI